MAPESGFGDRARDPQTRACVFHEGECSSKTVIQLVHELAADGFLVAVTCWVDQVAPSTYCEAIRRQPSAREDEDRDLTGLIVEVHHDSRGTYGAPRVHVELRMGLGLRIGRKRVARLMRGAGIHVARIVVNPVIVSIRRGTMIW